MSNERAVEIDWATASVKDSRLSVGMSGSSSKGFGDQLERVISRLATGGQRWGEVSVGKRKLHVEDVESGAEDDVRHFLESAVLQANAAIGAESGDAPEEATGPDEEMAAVFRAFADRG